MSLLPSLTLLNNDLCKKTNACKYVAGALSPVSLPPYLNILVCSAYFIDRDA